ncbi:MAG: MotA/TolQ/ExbB proton channel family protein [Bradymonadaceae bacterium]
MFDGTLSVALGASLLAVPGLLEGTVVAEYLNAGGWMMYVILAVSVLGFVIFFERFVALFFLRRLDAESFTDRVVTLIAHRKIREALDVCDISSNHPLAAVAKEGLARANRREKEIERAMESEMLSALPDLRKRVSFLSVLANVATLLGLLGTIFGLIMAFTSVSAASAAQRQEALAAGISQAMYTTAFGISVAVPMLLFHHVLSQRVERIVSEVETGASSILVAISGAIRGEEEDLAADAATGSVEEHPDRDEHS